jgi:NAD(P)-dependent dehydrogenase (short-subunit alcohol dehydrogenase family)
MRATEFVAMCPGTVQTEWIDKIIANEPDPDATQRAMGERQLDGRMGTPDEVAAGIAFIVSSPGSRSRTWRRRTTFRSRPIS